MINILKKLLDFIYDTKCYFCSGAKEDTIFCSSCYNSVEFIKKQPFSEINGSKVYAAAYYENIIQKLIRAVKYHNKKELAKYQAKLMYEFWQFYKQDKKYTVLPVPMFYSKLRKRKYNHMDLVCEEFCKLTGDTLNTTSLIRNRETKPQYKLSRKERQENLKDAFEITDKNITEPILLVDDICTTGTTLEEITKVLNQNNFYDITCLVTAVPKYKM